ncbi:Golgi to ER traffic protein 4-like protein [Dinothrombium tinctorium]|uniref:Golgi to ER traffic protein 4-like protein n=1 Tax=Dinothrombium tinctorium TaxID=1965070 RepID=A0A3S3PL90_9ACAR|nr:Golgi to ER traffic protein 4-like protein [Dinothrombium tinctorium]
MAQMKGERIVVKLRKLLDANEYYEAHQLYRTLYFRYSNSKRFEELQELLYEGADRFLSRGQFNSGADLASLYLDAVNADANMKLRLSDDKCCVQLSQRIADLMHKIPSKSSERVSFMMSALKLRSDVFPLPLIHYQFALILWREKNFPESRYHFLHSPDTCGEDCALMLIEYHITSGYPSEVDLFIAQFILQLLCIKKVVKNRVPIEECVESSCSPSTSSSNGLKIIGCKSVQHAYANKALQCFTTKHPQIQKKNPPFLLPLLNFLWFLLLAIDSGKSSTFKVLCDLYSPILKRDPSYNDYLSKIGELYFGLQSTARNRPMGGFLGNLLQSFFEDENDNNEEETLSAGTAANRQVDEELD